MAGLLRILGMQVPQPEVAADETNPKGFSEPRWVVDTHERLLDRCGVQVADARPQAWTASHACAARPEEADAVANWLSGQLADNPALVIKDPRLSWFLPAWESAAERAGARIGYVTMLRPPAEVIGSRQTYYHGLGPTHLAASWLNMMLHTEADTRGDRVFVRYADLLSDWRSTMGRVSAVLGLGLDPSPQQSAEADAFVDPTLRRLTSELSDLDLPDGLRDLVDRAWHELDGLADPAGDTPDAHRRLDALRAEYQALYRQAEELSASSVVAARRQVRRELRSQQSTAARRDIAARVPHRIRAMVPDPLRRGVRRLLGRPR